MIAPLTNLRAELVAPTHCANGRGHTLAFMPSQLWRLVVLVLGGAVIGLGVAGLPNRRDDPPLRVQAETTTTTTLITTTTQFTTTTTAPTTSTTRRRP